MSILHLIHDSYNYVCSCLQLCTVPSFIASQWHVNYIISYLQKLCYPVYYIIATHIHVYIICSCVETIAQ